MRRKIIDFLKLVRTTFFWSYPVRRNDADIVDKMRLGDPIYLERYGFKVYSQNDEDGYIEEIFNRIGTTDKRFVEFGVSDGLECNGHYLLHKSWKGLWIEGSKKLYKQLLKNFEKPLMTGQLTAINAFISAMNINDLIGKKGDINGEIDLLSIDIDGNDYWIWNAISCVKPRVVVIEYNAKFPPPYEWIMPYNPNHIYDGTDMQGASLEALVKLGNKLGYDLVGTSMSGVNAFFVRSDLIQTLFAKPATAKNLYNPWSARCYVTTDHKTKYYIG